MADKAEEEVPDYMVHVKKEYLVDHRKSKVQSSALKSDRGESASGSVTLANAKEGNAEASIGEDEESEPAVGVDGVREGYKSNGYKIDERDKQNSSYIKKDYTGGTCKTV